MTNEQILYIVAGILGIFLVSLSFMLFSKSKDASELKERLDQAKQVASQLEAKNENLERENSLQAQNLARLETQTQNYAQLLQERNETILNLQDQISKNIQSEDELEKQINILRQNLGTSEQIGKEREAQISYLRENLAATQGQTQDLATQNSALLQELTRIKTSLDEKEQSFKAQQENLKETKERLNAEFQSLASKILEEKSANFTKHNQTSLDLILKPLKEKIESFEKRVNEVHTESIKGNATLENEIKKVLDIGLAMSKDAQNLTTALKGNNKLAGNWGEAQLEASLQAAGLIAGEHYEAQSSYKGEVGEKLVPDFVINMPDGKHLIIDSKVSLIAYERAISATNEAEIAAAMSEHVASLKAHIASLAKKDYSAINGLKSPDFVLMFVPIEPAYIEAMRFDAGLFGYGFERRVVLVSHTTLMPILRTVANLWRIERGNKEARQIAKSAGEIYNSVCSVAEALKKLGNSLNTVSTHYNDAVTKLSGRQGLAGKVERFSLLSHKSSQDMPQLGEFTAEFHTKNLENLANEKPENLQS